MMKDVVDRIYASLVTSALPNKPRKPNKPNSDKNWVEKVEDKQKGKTQSDSDKIPEGTFDGSPSSIANTLKSKSKTLKQAVSRLQFYINRSGDSLSSADLNRLDRAKEAVYRSFGEEPPAKR